LTHICLFYKLLKREAMWHKVIRCQIIKQHTVQSNHDYKE
jgi:hypothetical protein